MLIDLIKEENIINDLTSDSKTKAIEAISSKLAEDYNLASEVIFKAFIEREETTSTGMVGGIAIPHVLLTDIDQSQINIVRLTNELGDWETLDGSKVSCLIVLSGPIPKSGANDHLKILSSFARLLMNSEFLEVLQSGTLSDIKNKIKELSI